MRATAPFPLLHRSLPLPVLLLGAALARADVIIESGSLFDEITRLRGEMFDAGSGDYIPPDSNQLASFRSMAEALYDHEPATADTFAADLGYEIVAFTDTNTSTLYYIAREALNESQEHERGWGTYIINSSDTSRALVEVPHPLHDTYSWIVGGNAYIDSAATGFLLAGAHRDANGEDTADVAHLAESVFQTVHEAWTDLDTDLVAFSVHGFNILNEAHAAYPDGTDFVLSNGTGGVSDEVIALDAAFEDAGFTSHAFNTLDPADALNVTVNGEIDGETFSPLGATTTEQRIYSTSVGATFVHIEIERELRVDADDRALVATTLASTIVTLTAVPEPATTSAVGALAALAFVVARRRLRR